MFHVEFKSTIAALHVYATGCVRKLDDNAAGSMTCEESRVFFRQWGVIETKRVA